jgi:hypothetical protein
LAGKVRKVIANAFRGSLEVRRNKNPRFFSLDQFEQPSILIGRSIALASCSTGHFFEPA